MNRTRTGLTALAVGLPALTLVLLTATRVEAQGIPDCGGPGIRHTVPEGGTARCAGSRVLSDGLRWQVIVEVRDTGVFGARFTRPQPAPAGGVPVELEAHLGGSGDGEAAVLTGTLPAGMTEVTLTGQFDPAVLLPFDCVTQTDAKARNGEKDTPQNRVRIAGGWFKFEDCAPAPAPTTVPETSPSTVPNGPGTTVTTPGTDSPGTRPPRQGSSVPGGTLPATGPASGDIFGWGIVLTGAGVILTLTVIGARRRQEQP